MTTNIDRLEQQLMMFSSATRYPATPNLAAGFWQRLEAASARRPAPRVAFAGGAFAAIVVAIAVTLALAAPARDAAADLFHRINIFETSQSTEGLPTTSRAHRRRSPRPRPRSAEASLSRLTRRASRSITSFGKRLGR